VEVKQEKFNWYNDVHRDALKTVMNKTFTLILFLIISFLAVSCMKEDSAFIPLTGDYLPMQINNYWDIEHSSRITITGTRVIENKTYFEFVQDSDTTYYRNENNKIFCRRLTHPESVLFDLTAHVDETWKYQPWNETMAWNITLVSTSDTVLINHTKIPNCYHFYFDIPGAADEEHGIWLAPGIGFIKKDCGFCPYPFLNLIKAKINDKEITFQ
jgi:hypothetical protein